MPNRVPRSKWFGRRKTSGERRDNASTPSASPGGGSDQGGDGASDAKRKFARYVELAKAAASSGDAVESEKYYQYADHFLRLMKDKPA
ncbi:MAG: DUF4167 domain-containing protein [Rhodospirillales bacterium]|nr:DUF4167 domain-containing protein [Rhodospirillales bacterium]